MRVRARQPLSLEAAPARAPQQRKQRKTLPHRASRRLEHANAAGVQRRVDVAHQVQLDAIRWKGERREQRACTTAAQPTQRQQATR
jgi:hypothetical protein